MKVRVEEVSSIERKLSIEVESAMVAQELEKAYKALSHQVKVPGFRQGKVPRRILEQHYKTEVESDVVQRVVQRAYFDAIKEHSVEAVGVPKVTPEKLVPNAPFSFEARVEVKPELKVEGYKGIEFKRSPIVVDEKEVEDRITQLRDSMSQLEEVVGREVLEAGDFALVDYAATSEGKDFPGNRGEKVTMEVAPGELIEGNVESLAGLKLGETRTINYVFPASYRVESLQGKPAVFELTLRTIKKKVLPELNDEFAKNTGAGVETLDALKDRIRRDLNRAQKQTADKEEREALIKVLVEKNTFDVPQSMVERTIDLMLEAAFDSLYRSGVDPRQLQLNFESIRQEMRPRADSEVRGTLLFEAIAEQEKISVSDQEVEKKIEALAEEAGQPVAVVKKRFATDEQKRSLSLRLREEKTIDFLKAQAKQS